MRLLLSTNLERAYRLLVDVVAVGIAMAEATETMRLAARAETIGQQCEQATRCPELAHITCRFDSVDALQAELLPRETKVQFALSLDE